MSPRFVRDCAAPVGIFEIVAEWNIILAHCSESSYYEFLAYRMVSASSNLKSNSLSLRIVARERDKLLALVNLDSAQRVIKSEVDLVDHVVYSASFIHAAEGVAR